MRHRTRRLRNGLLALFAVPSAYLLAAAFAAFVILPASDSGAPKTRTAYLASNGIHLNIVLPVRDNYADWQAFLPDAALSGKSHVYIGWGSTAFYTQVPAWKDLRPGIALRALFYDTGALNVVGADTPPPEGHHLVRTIHLDDLQYQTLVNDIQSQFHSRRALPGHPGFYAAHGRYTPFFTCNEWMRRRLRHIGLPVPLWSPFDRPLLWAFPQ